MTKTEARRLAKRAAADLIECAIAAGEDWAYEDGDGVELDDAGYAMLHSALLDLAEILRKQGGGR